MPPMRICAFEDAATANLQPLTTTRPAFALRCGISSLLDKQRRFFGASRVGAWIRPALATVCRQEWADVHFNDPAWLTGAADGEVVVLVNGRWLPPAKGITPLGGAEVGTVGEEVAYVALPASQAASRMPDDWTWQVAQWRE